MTSWRWIVFGDTERGHIESHMVHAWMKRAVLADLAERYPNDKVEAEKEANEMYMDLPGVVAVERPTETFSLLGLRIVIPCEDVAAFAGALLNALTDPETSRHWRGTGIQWMKLRAFCRILVLTRNQASALWRMMDERAVETGKRADAFNKVFLKRLSGKSMETVQ